jgi:hypothetical protein
MRFGLAVPAADHRRFWKQRVRGRLGFLGVQVDVSETAAGVAKQHTDVAVAREILSELVLGDAKLRPSLEDGTLLPAAEPAR